MTEPQPEAARAIAETETARPEPAQLETISRHFKPLRKLYNWVLSWADTPYGTPALAVISFTESSFFPIPPDVLQVALSVSRPRWSFYYATVNMLASVVGGILGWLIGYALWEAIGWMFFYIPGFTQENFLKVQAAYQGTALLAIIGAAFTPIPYKIFTIAAGVFGVSLPVLIVGSVIGRGARFFLVATCIFFFGEKVRRLLETYFEIATLLAFALLVGGFVAVKYLL